MTDSPSVSPDEIRTYVLDTSVLLSDPWACNRFAEHQVVVPLVVISELEAKRHHHELGWFARQALRMFDDLRLEHGRLDQPIPVGTQGGTLHVELNHSDPSGAARRFPHRHQRRPHPDVCGQPRRRGQVSHVGQQGHSAAGQGRGGRTDGRRVPRAGRRDVRLDGHVRGRRDRRGDRRPVRRRRDRARGRHGICRATPEFGCWAADPTRWAG